ncbi:RCC1 and BTB domain-containing protein 1-like isoform X1 [Hylaeus anthracinus]|uniref:RCC1 and BTB domain-containing protein 1-like isoform X1 n=1 Tax=Hylaeus anthracinus TaxID=313031 RepID=UPI0023B98FD2|nr:RCC1 and BTB domain-containing protein 1-like isoform X1 [Hylaeus anthracinus]
MSLQNWPVFSFLEPKFISKIHMVIVYGSLGNEALIVTKDKMVYGVGKNACGCLGTGDHDGTLCPKKVDALRNKDIKLFAYGKGPHVLALTADGQVYSWGYNTYYELGNGTTTQGSRPVLVGGTLSDKFVVDIACGGHHSLALTDDGVVYAWGKNSLGQVAATVHVYQSTPSRVHSTLADKKVVCISCGHSSSIAVTNDGEVYSWGSNATGQLGIGNYINQLIPHKVALPSGVIIKKVMCGYSHALALSYEGVLYVWGENKYGQLGLNDKKSYNYPVKLESRIMGRILDVATSHYNHISIAMTEANQIFLWGQCLGLNVTEPIQFPVGCMHDALAYYASPGVMHQPLILHDEKEEMSLTDCLKEAFDDSSTSDLVIQVRGKPIYVHKAVLKIRSQYFRRMFRNTSEKEKQSIIIKHQEFSYDVYRAFLKYLYTDQVDLPPESIRELLDLANIYSESQLKECCMQMVMKPNTVDKPVPASL